jgi:hypothetical protein
MDQRDYQAAARQIVETLGPEAARELLMLLDSDDAIRADTFRQLLDSLGDLEADPVMRGWLVEHLRIELGRV